MPSNILMCVTSGCDGENVELIENQKRKLQGAYDKFPDFFRVGAFIDSTYMKLKSPSK